MPLTRHFMGWDRPALHAMVDYLVERFSRGGELDLRSVTVALPVARAIDRLEELLVERAEKDGVRLVPPRRVTVGGLAEVVVGLPSNTADELTRQLVWARVLEEMSGEALAALLPHPPERGDVAGWVALGRLMDGVHTELAGACVGFGQAADAASELCGEQESQRWVAAATAQRAYMAQLHALGLVDPQQFVADAVKAGNIARPGPIVMIASDLTRLQCRMIERVGDDVACLVFAPSTLADAFDELGNVRSERWATGPIEIGDQRLSIVERPADQAEAVLRAIGEQRGRLAADQISVGVLDAALSPYIEQRMACHELPARNTAGRPVARSGPYRLLAAAADYIESQRFADLATLLRHPDMERWLLARVPEGEAREGVEDWLTLMDRYYADHLHGKLSGRWLGKSDRRDRLKRIHDQVQGLVGPLMGPARPLRQWAEPIRRVLLGVYDRGPLDTRDPVQQAVLADCVTIGGVLKKLDDLPDAFDEPLDGVAALRLVLGQLEGVRVAQESTGPAVELLGWLELSLDDAPALIVTGFNEGNVPESVNSDAMLPNGLRKQLGLRDNDARYARDAYLLSTILASRPYVRLIAGRWSADGDPLSPSRLMLACGEDRLPALIRRFYTPAPSAPATWPPRLRAAEVSAFMVPPRVPPLTEPLPRISVTAFRDYITCPYRFYLKHILGLEHVDTLAEEMDGGAFGKLAHDVLRLFGRSDGAASLDPRRINQVLHNLLDERADAVYGSDPSAAVRVQVEQLRSRLGTFATQQAEHARKGWRIHHIEESFADRPALLDVDGRTIQIVGRIDRIDVNEQTGRYAVFDYKTGEIATAPDKAHRSGGQWVDLQLPLYRLMLGSMGVGDADLGYIVMSRDPTRIGFEMAEWQEPELREAVEVARQVVRDIWANKFEPTPEPPALDDFGDICGVLHLAPAMEGGEEE